MAESSRRDADRSSDRTVPVFFSSDQHESAHVHVERETKRAKFWLDSVEVETNDGFKAHELARITALVQEHREELLRAWHDFSAIDETPVPVQEVRVTSKVLEVVLKDGRSLSVPIKWYPRLAYGSPRERQNWRLIGDGIGIHWPALDEDISISGLLAGLRSEESGTSLKRWLAARRQPPAKALEPTSRARHRGKASKTKSGSARG